ncbi:MAG: ATP-binding protein [Syntrophaceae bacterium]|nr:ATP-binding protein [Syntrophaceae bacterium]
MRLAQRRAAYRRDKSSSESTLSRHCSTDERQADRGWRVACGLPNAEQFTPGSESGEMVAFLIEAEWDDRNNRRIERQIRNARFRYNANIEQLHFDVDRNLEKNQILRFAECKFIKNGENILITGSTGIGKSYLASALGNQVCMPDCVFGQSQISLLFCPKTVVKANSVNMKINFTRVIVVFYNVP